MLPVAVFLMLGKAEMHVRFSLAKASQCTQRARCSPPTASFPPQHRGPKPRPWDSMLRAPLACPSCPTPPQDAEERCNSMPRCQAFTFGPPSNAGPLGKSKTPLIGYVGYGDGRPIDINSSSGLSPLMITYVKQGQLAANSSNSSTSAQEEQDLYGDGEGGGLSGGAIAGEVAQGSTCSGIFCRHVACVC